MKGIGKTMAGTKQGGHSAAVENKAKYGDDFYKRIGAKGGSVKGIKKGFALNPSIASAAGKKGGTISRRNRTHCNRGHEFTPLNTYITPKSRICRTCHLLREARRREVRREARA